LKKLDDGEIIGDNTDGEGLVQDLLQHQVVLKGARILLLGAGGAARGVIQPLLDQRPQQLVVANRTSSKAELLADMFATHGNIKGMGLSDVNEGFDVIINSTSSGLSGQLPEVSPAIFNSNSVVYDMVYGSGNTVFNQWALDNGVHAAYDGLGMLVGQAAESFMLWRGLRPGTKQILRELRKNLEI
jgi:shikimate dehydrogenase